MMVEGMGGVVGGRTAGPSPALPLIEVMWWGLPVFGASGRISPCPSRDRFLSTAVLLPRRSCQDPPGLGDVDPGSLDGLREGRRDLRPGRRPAAAGQGQEANLDPRMPFGHLDHPLVARETLRPVGRIGTAFGVQSQDGHRRALNPNRAANLGITFGAGSNPFFKYPSRCSAGNPPVHARESGSRCRFGFCVAGGLTWRQSMCILTSALPA